ncbi:MAG: hypothetical protein J6M39_09575 [Lachnospiraceae bacterium]|nr:hypothetical protein [Lachnospiraceae bacterium]
MINRLKKEYLDRVRNELSDSEFDLYIKSFSEKETHGMTINFNKLKNSSIDLDYLIDKFDLIEIYKNNDYGYYTYDKEKLKDISVYPGKNPLYHAGLYYIQEPSAASVLSNVTFNPSDVVLDLCASPGGKSIQTLYNLKGDCGGFLVANEIDKKRVKILDSNIERMGFDNFIILSESVDNLLNKFNDYFDKIIVDAPCSGEGMFRKSEDAVNQWSIELIKSCSKTQKKLIESAYHMLKSGGTLIYSTCTFSKEEDEEVIDYILNKYQDLKLVKMEKIYPFNSIGEGQFYAILYKEGNEYNSLVNTNITEFSGLNIVRYGISEWEDEKIKKPTHASTHSDKILFENIVDLNDEEVYKYLKGDIIKKDLGFKGFCKVTYKRLGLGLAKYVDGVIKNHYPKGLRIY